MAAAQKYWFRPKSYGYGAEPSNWKGWLATGAFILFVLAITLQWLVLPAASGQKLPSDNITLWVAVVTATTAAFVWLCWIKTDGAWRWRWGKNEQQ